MIPNIIPTLVITAATDIGGMIKSLLQNTPGQWRRLRGSEISMIFQDSGAMLNPTRKIGDVFVEYIRTHARMSRAEAWKLGIAMLSRMRLPDVSP